MGRAGGAEWKREFVEEFEIPAFVVFGVTFRKAEVGRQIKYEFLTGDKVPDDANAEREFIHQCGLVHATSLIFPDGNIRTMLYLDGHRNLNVSQGVVEFRITRAKLIRIH